jgi:hypothetical protein
LVTVAGGSAIGSFGLGGVRGGSKNCRSQGEFDGGCVAVQIRCFCNGAPSLRVTKPETLQRHENLRPGLGSGLVSRFWSARALTLLAFPLLLAKVARSLNMHAAKYLLGCKLIVRSATHAEIFGVITASDGSRFDVIELEERSCIAPATVRGNVRAA